MMLPDDENDLLTTLAIMTLAFVALVIMFGATSKGDEPRRRISLEEPELAPRKRAPAATPESAVQSKGSASAPGTDGVPADPRPLVIVYTVPKQCAPCREFDRWADKHAAKSPFRFQAREYARFEDLPAKVGTVPQFEFSGADGKRHKLNGWHDNDLMPLVAEYMRHNPQWKPTRRGEK